MLRTLAGQLGLNSRDSGDRLQTLGHTFEVGTSTEVRTKPLQEDLDEISAVVRNASRLADYTIVTIHTHESGATRFEPPQFLRTFARTMIDAGADVMVGHGPHVLRGIEVYNGRPILYSLGNFLFENETVQRLPSEAYEGYGLPATAHVADFNDQRFDFDRRSFPARSEYWESVVAVVHAEGDTLTELQLYPITLGFGKRRTVRGRPMLAAPELGRKIIDGVTRLSEALGTKIRFSNGVGTVKLTAGSVSNQN
jgi:poly-gamma-glutamate synthesis protein (capsule biosynthesis protein)